MVDKDAVKSAIINIVHIIKKIEERKTQRKEAWMILKDPNQIFGDENDIRWN